MHSTEIRILAKKLRKEGRTYKEIGERLDLSLFSARKLCTYNRKVTKKRGRKFLIDKRKHLAIKRCISTLSSNGEKINSKKIINQTGLNESQSTVQRWFTRQDFKYKKASKEIILSKAQKVKRLDFIGSWFSDNHPWEQTIFSDEKRFSMDGPDNWWSYVKNGDKIIRRKRQCKGGSVMIWLMCLPNGLLSFRVINGILKSVDYIALLKQMIVPIIKLNYGDQFFFQEDNCSVHKSSVVRKFMSDSNIQVVKWPANSPDINIVEDIWEMISNKVYDGSQFLNRSDLVEKIEKSIYSINNSSRSDILNLYVNYRKRLMDVVRKNGNLFNK